MVRRSLGRLVPSRGGAGVNLARWRRELAAVAEEAGRLRASSDVVLRELAVELRRTLVAGAGDDTTVIHGFALAVEAARRAVGLDAYPEQVAGGLALHRGAVVEMQTGEGKTLAAVAPVLMAALTGRGAHVLTHNDYLAERDADWMGPAYRFLGLDVCVVVDGMSPERRRQAYAADVTYSTVREAGFDLLRDGLALRPSEQVLRPLHWALVDEADSLMVDEARVPLVIVGATATEVPPPVHLAAVVRSLEAGRDFSIDEAAHNIFVTDAGARRVELALHCADLFLPEQLGLIAAVRNALHAEFLLRRDVDYVVRDRTVALVDELTGRVAELRQWPDGLQAAVEAKEGLKPADEGLVLGSITVQHFLRLYPRLCGMTGTAMPAGDELREVYGLDVVAIPTHRPCIRTDGDDVIFTHAEARRLAVEEEIVRCHESGRPVLVGTGSVRDSELLARAVRARGLPCRVLNARQDREEAEVIAAAGAPGAVTISTNMAGRGTDIRLGGPDESARDAVVAKGGLCVVGTVRHLSRRVDDQLRGRAGRQGDPGSSRFFVSLDDELPTRYGLKGLLGRRGLPERSEEPVDSAPLRREVERVQRISEGEGGDIRRRLFRYADVVEHQRSHIMSWRQEVLDVPETLTLLAEERPGPYAELVGKRGRARTTELERELTLRVVDRCWTEHLAELRGLREEIHLVQLDGRDPLAEFVRFAVRAHGELEVRIESEILATLDRLDLDREDVDWGSVGLERPSATWTYLVSDNVWGANVMRTLAVHATWGLWATILLWPVLLVWGVYERWRRRRARKSRPAEPGP